MVYSLVIRLWDFGVLGIGCVVQASALRFRVRELKSHEWSVEFKVLFFAFQEISDNSLLFD